MKELDDWTREHIAGKQIVASISGGKDSAALSLWLTEQGIEHRRIFADTGWEAPETYDYLRGELQDKIGPIEWVQNPDGGMAEHVRKFGMWPAGNAKWCTRILKMQPLYTRMAEIQRSGAPVLSCVGIRWDESDKRAAMDEFDGFSMGGEQIEIWRPILDWTADDVIDIHRRHDLLPNPLYLAGAKRVGCWPCIYSRKSEVKQVADRTPERIDLIEMLEAEVGDRMRERGNCSTDLVGYFFHGKFNAPDGDYSIRNVVEWARTGRGGVQFELFDTEDPDAGCVRWGMCEHPRLDD